MIPIPTNTEAVIDPRTGHLRPSWRQFFDRLRKQFAETSPGLIQLASGTVSNAATLDIVLTNYSAYRRLRLVLNNWIPVNNNVGIVMRLSSDGGASFISSGYQRLLFWWIDGTSGGHGVSQNSNDSFISVSDMGSNNAAIGGINSVIDLIGHADASKWTRVEIVNSSGYNPVPGLIVSASGCGALAQPIATNAVRVFFGSGNIASGSWALYGYA